MQASDVASEATPTTSTLEEKVVRALVDAAPDGLLMADENGRILFANRQLDDLFGYARGDLLGRSVDDLLPTTFVKCIAPTARDTAPSPVCDRWAPG